MIDEPAVTVEEEDLGGARRLIRLGHLLGLVVQEGKDEALLARPGLHLLEPVAQVVVRVDHHERGPSPIVPSDVVQPVLPGDHVRAVHAREDDRDRQVLVVLESVPPPVDAGEVEGWRARAEREPGHRREC